MIRRREGNQLEGRRLEQGNETTYLSIDRLLQTADQAFFADLPTLNLSLSARGDNLPPAVLSLLLLLASAVASNQAHVSGRDGCAMTDDRLDTVGCLEVPQLDERVERGGKEVTGVGRKGGMREEVKGGYR